MHEYFTLSDGVYGRYFLNIGIVPNSNRPSKIQNSKFQKIVLILESHFWNAMECWTVIQIDVQN